MMRDNFQGNMTANSMDASCYYEQGDQYDSGEDDSSLNRMRILGPVQLAPKHCDCSRCKWRGDEKPCVQKYVTINEMKKHYNDRLVSETLDLQAQKLAIIGQMQSDFRAAMKVKDEEARALLSQHNTFMASLPKESRAGKERRLQQKQKDLLDKCSNRKVGFKKRVIKDTPIEVVTARRALRRKESRDNKKKEELERAANFTVKASAVEVSATEEAVETSASEVSSIDASASEVASSVVTSATEVASTVEAVVTSATEVASTVEAVVTSATETSDVSQEVKKPHAKKSVALPNPTHKLAQMCRSVGTTEPCRHGSSCRFAHDTSKLDYNLGVDCRNVVCQESGVYKTTAKTVCSSLDDELVIRVPKELALQAMDIAMKLGKTNIRIEIV